MSEPLPDRTTLTCGCPSIVGVGAAEGEYCDDCHLIVRRLKVRNPPEPTKAFDGSLYCPDCGGALIDPRPWQAHDDPLMCDTCEYTYAS